VENGMNNQRNRRGLFYGSGKHSFLEQHMNERELLDLADRAGFEIEGGEVCVDGVACTDEVRTLIEMLAPRQDIQTIRTRPVDRYIVLYAEAEELLNQLRESHEANHGVEPSEVDWGDVGALSNFVEVLQFAVRSLPNRAT
jgi:hypothetical protein